MRQRRVTGIEERLAPYSDLILRHVDNTAQSVPQQDSSLEFAGAWPQDSNAYNFARLSSPQKYYLRWYQRPSELYGIPKSFDRIYAEFGCGRGNFINTLAGNDPEGLYIGIEGCKTIVLRAIQKTHAAGLQNLFYIDSFVNDAATAFEEETLDGIFLNFSDPWPKERHAGRRLTAPAKAESYKRVLKPGGFVVFKTDSEAFFNYSLKSFKEEGFQIVIADNGSAIADLKIVITSEAKQSSTLFDVAAIAAAIPTEYEERFRALSKAIYSFQATR